MYASSSMRSRLVTAVLFAAIAALLLWQLLR